MENLNTLYSFLFLLKIQNLRLKNAISNEANLCELKVYTLPGTRSTCTGSASRPTRRSCSARFDVPSEMERCLETLGKGTSRDSSTISESKAKHSWKEKTGPFSLMYHFL